MVGLGLDAGHQLGRIVQPLGCYACAVQRDLFDVITLAIALVGAVLGVFSTWRVWLNDRVRVRVKVSYGLAGIPGPNDHPRTLAIDVVNLSAFPVTIVEVGFTLVDMPNRLGLALPEFLGGNRLPVRLEARTSATVIQPLVAFKHEHLVLLERAYVRTACGVTCKSGRDVLRQLNHAALAAGVDVADP